MSAAIFKNITNEISDIISVKRELNAVNIGGNPIVSNMFCDYASRFAKEYEYITNIKYTGINNIQCLFEYDVIFLEITLEYLNPFIYRSYDSMDFIRKLSELDIIKARMFNIINTLSEYKSPIVIYSFSYNTYISKIEDFSYDAFICEVNEFVKHEIYKHQNFHLFDYNTYIYQSLY